MLSTRKGVALFTDGSAYYKDGSGGWAWVAIDDFGNEEVGSGHASDVTNNQMEMRAWVEGLNHLADQYGPCDILLYCDSQYVINCATDKYSRKRNQDLWDKVDEAMERHDNIECIWIRGHDGSYYNHLADQLAGNARRAGRDDSM